MFLDDDMIGSLLWSNIVQRDSRQIINEVSIQNRRAGMQMPKPIFALNHFFDFHGFDPRRVENKLGFQTRLDPLPAARSQREVTRQQSRPSDHSCRRSFRDIMAGRVVWQPRTQIIHHIVEDGTQTIVIPCNF